MTCVLCVNVHMNAILAISITFFSQNYRNSSVSVQVNRCGPVTMFLKLVRVWKHLTVEEVSAKVRQSTIFCVFDWFSASLSNYNSFELNFLDYISLIFTFFILYVNTDFLICLICTSRNSYASNQINTQTATELRNTRITWSNKFLIFVK
jgi:hypothetical protein